MESIKEKLRALQRTGSSETRIPEIVPSDVEFAKLGLASISNEFGSLYVREKKFSLDFTHGGYRLAGFLDITHKELSFINNGSVSSEIGVHDLLFFDSETTGLAGGSGTYIFMAGFGFFEENIFIVKQFFLTAYKNEYAYLYEIVRIFERFRAIISFNGKSFDIPLLLTRCLMNKLDNNLDRLVHIDLLYHARRLWKKSIQSCNLGNIEKKVLGFARQGDVDGAEVPKRFFEFLQTRQIELMRAVFKHNAIDILTLVSIVILSSRHFKVLGNENSAVEIDKVSLFKLFVSHGHGEKALELVGGELSKCETGVLLEYGFYLKRNGDWPRARRVWEHLLTRNKYIEVAYLELAKYYEHKSLDYSKALDIVNRATKRRDISKELSSAVDDSITVDWQHRKNRLNGKLAKKK